MDALLKFGWGVAAVCLLGGFLLATRPWQGQRFKQLASIKKEEI